MPDLTLSGDRRSEIGKIPEEELALILVAHSLWLSSEGMEGAQFDRPGANLIYGGFLQANLQQANLPGACLFHANLRECDLTGANLAAADLEGIGAGARLARRGPCSRCDQGAARVTLGFRPHPVGRDSHFGSPRHARRTIVVGSATSAGACKLSGPILDFSLRGSHATGNRRFIRPFRSRRNRSAAVAQSWCLAQELFSVAGASGGASIALQSRGR